MMGPACIPRWAGELSGLNGAEHIYYHNDGLYPPNISSYFKWKESRG